MERIRDSIKTVAGIQHFILFQRMPAVLPGNSLGLDASKGPLVLYLLSMTWNQAEDDDSINRTGKILIGRIEQATKATGLFR